MSEDQEGPVCYRCSLPIEGEVVWDTEPGDPAFHPVCAETTRREVWTEADSRAYEVQPTDG